MQWIILFIALAVIYCIAPFFDHTFYYKYFIKKRISNKDFVCAFQAQYPNYPKAKIILARKEVANYFEMPPDVIDFNISLSGFKKKCFLRSSKRLDDIFDDLSFIAEELEMELVKQRLKDVKQMGELIYLYLICIIQPDIND